MNLCATMLNVSNDNAELKEVVGTTTEVTKEVATRPEDLNFASSLGNVLLQHATCFITRLQAGQS